LHRGIILERARQVGDANTYRQLQVISQTLLMMTGRITMLSISRWAGKG